MGIHVIQAFLDGIGELLYYIRMCFQVAFFGAVGGVGNVAGVFTQRSCYVSISFQLKSRGVRFEFYGIVCIAGWECSSSQAETDALVDGEVGKWVDAVLFQNILKDKFRHSAFAAA